MLVVAKSEMRKYVALLVGAFSDPRLRTSLSGAVQKMMVLVVMLITSVY